MKSKSQMRQLLIGGILPVVVYTVVEETLGIVWGLVAGMVIGVIEMLYEWVNEKKVSGITLGSTALILGLGAISLFTQEGVWFKLQPAIMEAVMAGTLFVSSALGKPLLLMMGEKQGLFEQMDSRVLPVFKRNFAGLNVRLGFFFSVHAVLAVFAALYWSTRAWAILKGVGFTLSMVLYLVLEVFFLRWRMRVQISKGI